jgi:site-specific DNA recombinase
MYIASVFAQLEREVGAERVRDNLIELAKSGRWLGGETPTGYISEGYEILSIKEINADNEVERKKKKAFKLKKKPKEGEIIEILFSKMEELKSLTAVESYLMNNNIRTKNKKLFTRFTLKTIYTNIVYAINDIDIYNYLKDKGLTIYAEKEDFDGGHGMIAYNKTFHQRHKANVINDMNDWVISVGKHEGYISGKRWINIQNIMKGNKINRNRMPRRNKALLSGILKCECGGYMRPKISSGRTYIDGEERFFYMCEKKEKSKGGICNSNNVDGNLIDKQIIEYIKKIKIPNNKIAEILKNISYEEEDDDDNYEIRRLEKVYSKNKKVIENLIDRIKYIDIDLLEDINKEIKELKEENKKIESKMKEISNNRSVIKSTITNSELENIVLKIVKEYFEVFDELDLLKKRKILTIFTKNAVWKENAVNVEINENKLDEFL